MEKFAYKAKRGLDEIVEGSINADNREDALNRLSAQGLFPVSIEKFVPPPAGGLSPDAGRPAAAPQRFAALASRVLERGSVSSKDRFIFTRKLSTLIRARVELLSALKILYEQSEGKAVKECVQGVYTFIKEGKPFSEALSQYPDVFNPFYVSMARAGETSGRLDLTLEQVSEFLNRQERLKSKVQVALAYPALLVCVGSISVLVLLNTIIPKIRGILETPGNPLPLVTKLVLAVSAFSQKSSLVVLPLLAVAFWFFLWYKKAYLLKLVSSLFKRRMPVVKALFASQEMANFSWALSLLLKSGVPLYQSLQIAGRNIEDKVLSAQVAAVCERLRFGEPLAKSMESKTNLPGFFIKMVGIGEESGRLPEVLTEISQSYAQEVEASVALISSLLEPLLILVIGSILGVIVFSIMLPIFQISSIMR